MKWMGKPGKDFIKKINSRKSRKFRAERLEKDFISLWKILSKKKKIKILESSKTWSVNKKDFLF